jgi:hypothetical protein
VALAATPVIAETTQGTIDPELAALGALAAGRLAAGPGAPVAPGAPSSAPDPAPDAFAYADAASGDDPDVAPPFDPQGVDDAAFAAGLPAYPSRIPLVIGAVAAVLLIAVIVVTLVMTSSAATPAG